MPNREQEIKIQGHTVRLSNIEKVLYPEASFTKGQVIDYYLRIAPVLLPHLKNRPLTMKRYPEGVNGEHFYEKNCPKHRPDWVQTAPIWSHGHGRWQNYCMANDMATLVWAANLADLELHVSLSQAGKIEEPTCMVFDLDPGAPADIVQCCQVGLWVRQIFGELGLDSFAKTSGSKGLQVYVPLNRSITYDQTKMFAKTLAQTLERTHPELVVSDMKKALRVGKILVDWSQNDEHKTTICVYSLRARPQPTVSTPVTWDEIESCWRKKDAQLLVFTSDQTLARVEKYGDLFEPVLTKKQSLMDASVLSSAMIGRDSEKRIHVTSSKKHASAVVSGKDAAGSRGSEEKLSMGKSTSSPTTSRPRKRLQA